MYKLNSGACVEYQSLFIAEGPSSNLGICLSPSRAFRSAGMCCCVNDSEYFGGMLYLFLRRYVGS